MPAFDLKSIFVCCAVAFKDDNEQYFAIIGPHHLDCYRQIKEHIGFVPKERCEEGYILSSAYCVQHRVSTEKPINRFVNRARAYEIYLEEGYEPLENPAFFGEYLWNKE